MIALTTCAPIIRIFHRNFHRIFHDLNPPAIWATPDFDESSGISPAAEAAPEAGRRGSSSRRMSSSMAANQAGSQVSPLVNGDQLFRLGHFPVRKLLGITRPGTL